MHHPHPPLLLLLSLTGQDQTPAPAPLPWHKLLLTVADSACSSPPLVLPERKKCPRPRRWVTRHRRAHQRLGHRCRGVRAGGPRHCRGLRLPRERDPSRRRRRALMRGRAPGLSPKRPLPPRTGPTSNHAAAGAPTAVSHSKPRCPPCAMSSGTEAREQGCRLHANPRRRL